MKKYYKVCKNIMIVLFFILLLGNLTQRWDKLYDIVGYKNYVVLTGSMEPSIYAGDMITITKVSSSDLKKGDIITYWKGDITITHRIIKIHNNLITTKGDSNNVEDAPITKEMIIGKYIFKIPKIGYLLAFIGSTTGMGLIVGIIFFLVLYELVFERERIKI
ncbi:MAG: signal peptidase I [Bacillota bacterium]|nr:signal peptidase I [Bacillota bacterium]